MDCRPRRQVPGMTGKWVSLTQLLWRRLEKSEQGEDGEERGDNAKGRSAGQRARGEGEIAGLFAPRASPCTSPFALSLRSSPSLRNLLPTVEVDQLASRSSHYRLTGRTLTFCNLKLILDITT